MRTSRKRQIWVPKRQSVSCQALEKVDETPDDLDKAVAEESTPEQSTPPESEGPNWAANIGLFAVLGLLIGYVVFLAPNQFPSQDEYFLKKFLNLVGDDGYQVNRVAKDLFQIMAVPPVLYAALLIPAGRSRNKVPAWPFVVASVGLGTFGLLPYFALWQPDPQATAPPEKSEVEGLSRLWYRYQESFIYGVFAALFSGYLFVDAALAGGPAWKEFFVLFETSRFINVMSIDFIILNGMMPFWLMNDANARSWKQKDTLGKILPYIPLIGPAIYLAMRPKPAQ